MKRKYLISLALILLAGVVFTSGCIECDQSGCRIVDEEKENGAVCGNGELEPGEQCEANSDCDLTEKCNDECECVPYVDVP